MAVRREKRQTLGKAHERPLIASFGEDGRQSPKGVVDSMTALAVNAQMTYGLLTGKIIEEAAG